MKKPILAVVIASVLLVAIFSYQAISGRRTQKGGLPDVVDFNWHIKPIISDKCFACHGPDANKRISGYRLDTSEGAFAALKDNPHAFGIIAKNTEKSEVVKRIFAKDTKVVMPPPESGLALTDTEKQLIKRWIEQGAAYKKHWAYLSPKKTVLPAVDDMAWTKNEIDVFTLAKMEGNGLEPSPEADRSTLARRLSFDLNGIPPDEAQLAEMVKSDLVNDAGYHKFVDKILAKPQYGERMAVDWLDAARYADSHGYQDDSFRSMWPWRDWVIHAFNKNYRYDDFVTWQLAGDLLPNARQEQILATGFNRNHPISQEGGIIDEEYRVEYTADRVKTFGKALLGTSLECARCHDHKYDPISIKEYYQVFAFFNNTTEKGFQFTAPEFPQNFIQSPFMTITDEDIQKTLKFVHKTDTGSVRVMIMDDMKEGATLTSMDGKTTTKLSPRKSFVLDRGVYDAPKEEVQPNTPQSILSFGPNLPKNRHGLAQWMFDKRNPLTARVFVNRVWQMFFGRGLVLSAEDFGNQGNLPSHPELLDWLAVDFMEHDWNIKYLIKKIVTSATYRQSSQIQSESVAIDPENIWLSRYTRSRLPAEFLRDQILASSGLLVAKMGGEPVKPYQPEGLWEATNAGPNRGNLTNYIMDKDDKLYRRSLYTLYKRTLPPPNMTLFDASTREVCEVRRQKTNTPLQALAMWNDITLLEASRVLGANLVEKHNSNTESAIQEAFRRIVSREAKSSEMDLLKKQYASSLQSLSKDMRRVEKVLKTGLYPQNLKADKTKSAALAWTIQTIYNMDAALHKN